MGNSKNLTSKQALFVAHYKTLKNATKAALEAGYSEKSAVKIGSQLLDNPKIAQEINSWIEKKREELSKEDFIDCAVKDYRELDITEPNKPRFLEIASKLSGHLGNNNEGNVKNQTLNVQINLNGTESQEQLWEMTRKLLEGS